MQVNPVTPVIGSEGTAHTDRHPQKRDSSTFHLPMSGSDEASRFKPVAEDGKDIVYRTVDPETGTVLTQVPSEEVLRVAKRLEELITEGKIK